MHRDIMTLTYSHTHAHVHTHFFYLKNLSGMKGTYMSNELSLFVPGKKGLEQPGNSLFPPHLGLSLCLSLSNTHTHVRAPAHGLPKDGSGALARWPCGLESAVGFVLVSRMCPRGFQAMWKLPCFLEGGLRPYNFRSTIILLIISPVSPC